MIVVILLVFLILLIGNLAVSKNNIFSPGVLTTTIWLFCLSLFMILKHNLPPLSNQFLLSISVWVFLYGFFSMSMQSVRFKTTFNYQPSKFVMDLYFLFSVCAYPFLLYFIYRAIISGPTGYWAMDLRLAALGKTKYFTQMYSGYHIIIWQASYLIELFYFSKKNRYRVFLLAFFLLSYALITMSKFSFLDFFIKTVFILYWTKKIKLKHILIGILCLFAFFVILQSIRSSVSIASKNDFVVLYLLSSMSAFDTLHPFSALHFGENTFRGIYTILYKTGFSQVQPPSVLLPFIKKPIETNTYTGMYPFFVDFGYYGVAILASFFGIFLGWLFKKAQLGSNMFTLLYAFLVSIVIFQYVGDIFFTYLPGQIETIIVLLIPFLATKYKIFYSDIWITTKIKHN